MTQRKKNILFLCSWYPCRTSPNNGDFIERHIECLEDAVNYGVLAVVEDPNLKGKWFELVEQTHRNVPHLIIYFKKSNVAFLKFLLKFIAWLKGYFNLKKRFKKFDLIHVHVLIDAGFIAYLISFFSKTPYIITEHSTIFLENNLDTLPKIIRPITRLVANRSKLIMPVSNFLKENIQRLGIKTPFHIIPNVVNVDLFRPAEKKPHPKLKFLHVSAFQDFKNVPGILRAVKALSGKRTDFSMTIAGDGDLERLEEMATDLNISKNIIRFKGRMTEQEVAATMQVHDCFVLFSDMETFGVVIVEALAVGIPVVATEVPCVVEILDRGNLGKIVPIRDVGALVNALDFMIDHPNHFEAHTLRKKAVDFYSKEVIKEEILKIYNLIIDGNHK